MLEQQGAKLQFILDLALLAVCPACRAAASSNYSRVYWMFAIRNIIEMWLLLLAFSFVLPADLVCVRRLGAFQLGHQLLLLLPLLLLLLPLLLLLLLLPTLLLFLGRRLRHSFLQWLTVTVVCGG